MAMFSLAGMRRQVGITKVYKSRTRADRDSPRELRGYRVVLSILPGGDEMWEQLEHVRVFSQVKAAQRVANAVRRAKSINLSNWTWHSSKASPFRAFQTPSTAKARNMKKKSKKKSKRSGRRAAKRTTTRTVTTKTTVTRNGKLKWRHIGSGHEALRGGNWYLVERLGSEWEVYFAQKGSENPRVISVQSSLAKGKASAERHAARQAMKSRNFCGSTGDDRCRGAQWMGIGRNKSKTRNCGIRNTKFWGN